MQNDLGTARSMRRLLNLDDYYTGITGGNRAVLGRAITLVESQKEEHRAMASDLLVRLLPLTGRSHRIGISGVPGVGKSTFINAFGTMLTNLGHKVAVLAIDPSSQVTGGSILGDKTRMGDLCTDEKAFIRPSPSACSLGGVARRTRETMLVCEAAGFDIILVETVGVGQSEVAVWNMVDTFLVLMLAGAGDELQGIKRGILELADIVTITKSDGDNSLRAQRAAQEYEHAFHYLKSTSTHWQPPVMTCSALTKTGFSEIWEKLLLHKEKMEASNEFLSRRRKQLRDWMWNLVDDALREAVRAHPTIAQGIPSLEQQVLNGETTAALAARRILESFGLGKVET